MEPSDDPLVPPAAPRSHRLAGALLFVLAAFLGISVIRACKHPGPAKIPPLPAESFHPVEDAS